MRKGKGEYLVRKDDEVMFDAKVANGLQFGFGEDFANGVVPGRILVQSRVEWKRRLITGC